MSEQEEINFELYKYSIEPLSFEGELPRAISLELPRSLVIVDPRLQREFVYGKAAKIRDDFDPNALGIANASRRPSSDVVLLDGQHRMRGGLGAGFAGPYYTRIFEHLTVQQEAKLFRQLNNTSKVGPLELYKVALTEEREGEVKLSRILDEFGLVAGTGNANSFAAIKTGLRILGQHDGEDYLRWAFRVVIKAWGHSQDSVNGQIIEALSMIRRRYGLAVDTDILVKKLAGRPGKAAGLLGDARTKQRVFGDSVKINVADAIVGTYNHSMKKFGLPDWRSSDAIERAEIVQASDTPAARKYKFGSGRA